MHCIQVVAPLPECGSIPHVGGAASRHAEGFRPPAGLRGSASGPEPFATSISLLPLSLAGLADRPCRRAREEGFANARPSRKAAAGRTHPKEAVSKLNGRGELNLTLRLSRRYT